MEELFEGHERDAMTVEGVVIGIVTDNKDPDNLGRIKVKYPVLDQTLESGWARMITFMAGKDRGGYFLPEVNDEVLVSFEFGNINHPYILGALWNGVDTPPLNNANGENNIREIKSRSGHIFKFDDKSGDEHIEIIDKTGNNKILISAKDNTITIETAKDIVLKAPQGTITLEANQVKIKASTELSMTSSGTGKLETTASLAVKSSAIADIEASGIMNIKGSLINLN